MPERLTWDDYYTFRDNNVGKGYRYEYTAEPTMSGVQYGADYLYPIKVLHVI